MEPITAVSEPAPTACTDDDDARRQLLGEVADGGTGFSDHGHQLDVRESESLDRGDQVVAGECVTACLDLGVEVGPGRGVEAVASRGVGRNRRFDRDNDGSASRCEERERCSQRLDCQLRTVGAEQGDAFHDSSLAARATQPTSLRRCSQNLIQN